MPSPFVGMDPYLELPNLWTGFHNELAVTIGRQLNVSLPDDYAAITETRAEKPVELFASDWDRWPDVAIDRPADMPEEGGTAVVAAPAPPSEDLEPDWAFETEREVKVAFVRVVRTLPDRKLVTAIEILSPWNKRSGRKDYLKRREDYLSEGVSLVEIDLLLGGKGVLPRGPRDGRPYYVSVVRSECPSRGHVYDAGLGDRLPRVAVPLLAPDPDHPLDLQEAFETTYNDGPYRRRGVIDYGGPPPESVPAWWHERIQTIVAKDGAT